MVTKTEGLTGTTTLRERRVTDHMAEDSDPIKDEIKTFMSLTKNIMTQKVIEQNLECREKCTAIC